MIPASIIINGLQLIRPYTVYLCSQNNKLCLINLTCLTVAMFLIINIHVQSVLLKLSCFHSTFSMRHSYSLWLRRRDDGEYTCFIKNLFQISIREILHTFAVLLVWQSMCHRLKFIYKYNFGLIFSCSLRICYWLF